MQMYGLFPESWCSTLQNASTLDDIYSIPKMAADALHFDGLSISHLVHSILGASFSRKIYANETVTVGGVEAVRWIGCQDQLGANKTGMQVLGSLFNFFSSLPSPFALSVPKCSP